MANKEKRVDIDPVEQYKNDLLVRVDDIYQILRLSVPSENTAGLAKEEVLAIKSGALSAYAFFVCLLGGYTPMAARGAMDKPALEIAQETIAIGMNNHKRELERFGL